MQKWISVLLLTCLLLSSAGILAHAATAFLGYTEADLNASGNQFSATHHLTIGNSETGTNYYAAQPFVPNGDPVTGCRLYLRIGDNATVTVEVRTALDEAPGSVLYSSSHSFVSDPHFTMGWWDVTFTRALALEAGKTYYLVFWCQNYHSTCQACSTVKTVQGLTCEARIRSESGSVWQTLGQKCFGFEMLTDPTARADGFPVLQPDGTLLVHDAESTFCFSNSETGSTVSVDRKRMTEGAASIRVAAPTDSIEETESLDVFVNFNHTEDLTGYRYFYVDVLIPASGGTPVTLGLEVYGNDPNNGRTGQTELPADEPGWHRIRFDLEEMTAFGTGSLADATDLRLLASGDKRAGGLALNFDRLVLSRTVLPSFTDLFYTDEELNETVDVSDIDYFGKTPSMDEILVGDPTGDGKVDRADALWAVRYAVGQGKLEARPFRAGDVNGDEVMNARDALLILKKEAGTLQDFPYENVYTTPPARPGFEVTTEGLERGKYYTISTNAVSQATLNVMGHDAARLVASLQGLINRNFDKTGILLILTDSNTETWVPYIQEHSDLMEGMEEVNFMTFNQWVTGFTAQIRECGMVLWDPDVPATANVAATVCGLDGYLPVRYDTKKGSLMNRLLALEVPVKLDLTGMFTGEGIIPGTAVPSTGSAKCDAYLWALEKYGARCSDDYLIYVPDGASAVPGNPIYEEDIHSKSLDYNRLFNHDYGISRRAFFFDLSPIEGEEPCDDPDQPLGTDTTTLKTILLNRYVRAAGEFGEIVGFPPWWIKYSNHNDWGALDPTVVESTFTLIIGMYNCYMDADGTLPNCSFYCQYPLKDHYDAPANHKPVEEVYDPDTVYLFMYTGDYDSSPWAVVHLYDAYDDPARGTIPITWSINPGLCRRVPMIFEYLYENQTENDYFTAANSGVGYLRPQSLFQSTSDRALPDADRAWIRLNKEYFERFDMDAIGFMIGTPSDEVCLAYNQFAPAGSNTNSTGWSPAVYAGAPYVRIKNGIGDPATTEAQMTEKVRDMLGFAQSVKEYHAAGFRTIKYTATQIAEVQEAFLAYAAVHDPGTTYKFVDYNTYFAMLEASATGRCVPEG